MHAMRAVWDSFLLYLRYSKLLIKAQFQYRLDAFMRSLAVLCRESVGVVVVYFTLRRFDDLNGWHLNELLFLFSFLFLTYGILILFFTGFRDFGNMVHSGGFDRILLRPRGIIFQLIVNDSDYFAAIGHGSLGVILFLRTAADVGIVWTPTNILYCIITVIGGVLIQASIFMLFSCTSFWTVKSDNIMGLLFYNTRRFAGYPLSIYPVIIQKLLIFVMPFAFVNYFPVQYFLHKSDMANYWEGFLYLPPVVGLSLLLAALAFWRVGLKHYSSTGS